MKIQQNQKKSQKIVDANEKLVKDLKDGKDISGV